MANGIQSIAAEDDEKRRRRPMVVLPLPGTTYTSDLPFAVYQGRVKKRLKRFLQAYQSGEIDLPTFEKQVKGQLSVAYDKAFKLGSEAKEIPEIDSTWIQGIEDSEFEFFDGFIEDMTSGEFSMPLMNRIGMYADKLGEVFWNGEVRSAPEGTLYNWVTTATESCDDCLDYEAGGPYAKEELPTVPGSGDTQCRGNCRCFLEVAEED